MTIRILLAAACILSSGALGGEPVSSQEEQDEPARAPRIFLDKAPRIVAYQLRRLDNRQLLLVERKTTHARYRPVYEAIVDREELGTGERGKALTALAVLNGSFPVEEILGAFTRLGDRIDGGVLHGLVHLLSRQPREQLRGRREAFARLAASSDFSLFRQVGFLGMLLGDGMIEKTWQLARDSRRTVDLLGSLSMNRDESLRSAFLPGTLELLEAGVGAAPRLAAIRALGFIPGDERRVFRVLASLIRSRNGEERDAAISSIRKIPSRFRDVKSLGPLAESLVSYVAGTGVEDRTKSEILAALELGREIASKLGPAERRRVRKALDALGVRVILVRTVPHQMRYDRAFFAVEAGKAVEVVIENTDIMPHNLVVTLPGALEEVGLEAESLPPERKSGAKQYVPLSDKVVFASHLVAPAGREKLSFVAPREPGEYPYVCTFPGHWRRMYGVMIVVENLEGWLENPVEPADPLGNKRKLVKEWKLGDLAGDLPGLGRGRDLETGAAVFREAGCLSCHGREGQGGNAGPDLRDVFKRWKGRRADVLRELLEPAKVVEEKYRVQVLQLRDGGSLSGLITREEGGKIWIVTDPRDPAARAVDTARVVARIRTPGSMMPTGLLNNFEKAEILDLLAWLEAGGGVESGPRKN